MNKISISVICFLVALLLILFGTNMQSNDIQYGDYIVLMNGHSGGDQELIANQPSYVKIYNHDGEELSSVKLEGHWDYMSYIDSTLTLYNESNKVCADVEHDFSVSKSYSCEWTQSEPKVIVGGNNETLYIEKNDAVLYFEKEPYFEETYNGEETIYYVVDFVQIKQ